tara:strand:- start:107 stop:484 length:378 start_codon:yes stop_codon:yes gene_type:complete
MEEEKEDWKESWIGWPSKNKPKETPKAEVKGIPEKAKDYLAKDYLSEEGNLGSSLYENIATILGVLSVFFGLILLLADYYNEVLGIVMIISGFFTYVSISWFGRVLKGLEQNNNYLQKILKERKI